MAGHRRRFLLALPVVAAMLWSCNWFDEKFNPPAPPPPSFDQTAFRDEILRGAPPLSEFDSASGITDTVVAGKTRGTIWPHRNARADTLYHRKFLAIVRVTEAYRGMKPNVWNYWVVADTSRGNGKFTSAYVAEDRTQHAMRHLSVKLHKEGRNYRRKAEFLFFSPGTSWGECSPGMCCCEAPTCR